MATEQQEHLRIEQLRHQSADELEHIAGREKENLEGWIPSLASEDEVREALEKAFDYRGDVTITRKDGDTTSTTSNADVYVAKLDSSGVQQWFKVAGSTTADTVAALAVDGSGNVYVTGTIGGPAANTPKASAG